MKGTMISPPPTPKSEAITPTPSAAPNPRRRFTSYLWTCPSESTISRGPPRAHPFPGVNFTRAMYTAVPTSSVAKAIPNVWASSRPMISRQVRLITIRPDGFHLTFTQPVNPEVAARPESWDLKTWTHIYHKHYGSPEVDHTTPKVLEADVADDRLSVNIRLDGLVEGHVHEFNLSALRSASGGSLVHSMAYYTVNEIPKKTKTKQILFVGNSYTRGIRDSFDKFVKSSGVDAHVEYVTPGGRTLLQHAGDAKVAEKIKSRKWDFVVLQDQSQTPAYFPDRFRKGCSRK